MSIFVFCYYYSSIVNIFGSTRSQHLHSQTQGTVKILLSRLTTPYFSHLYSQLCSSVSVNSEKEPDLDISLTFRIVLSCFVILGILYLADAVLVDNMPSDTSSIAFCKSSLLPLKYYLINCAHFSNYDTTSYLSIVTLGNHVQINNVD